MSECIDVDDLLAPAISCCVLVLLLLQQLASELCELRGQAPLRRHTVGPRHGIALAVTGAASRDAGWGELPLLVLRTLLTWEVLQVLGGPGRVATAATPSQCSRWH